MQPVLLVSKNELCFGSFNKPKYYFAAGHAEDRHRWKDGLLSIHCRQSPGPRFCSIENLHEKYSILNGHGPEEYTNMLNILQSEGFPNQTF